jgi:hypothetical protein
MLPAIFTFLIYSRASWYTRITCFRMEVLVKKREGEPFCEIVCVRAKQWKNTVPTACRIKSLEYGFRARAASEPRHEFSVAFQSFLFFNVFRIRYTSRTIYILFLFCVCLKFVLRAFNNANSMGLRRGKKKQSFQISTAKCSFMPGVFPCFHSFSVGEGGSRRWCLRGFLWI